MEGIIIMQTLKDFLLPMFISVNYSPVSKVYCELMISKNSVSINDIGMEIFCPNRDVV